MGKIKTKHIIGLSNLFFFLCLFVFWRFFYVSHLLQKEQMQLFLISWDYLAQHLAKPGGLAIYLGEFITQFFINAWLAAGLFSLLLFSLAVCLQKVFKMLTGRTCILLSFIPAIAYQFLFFDIYYQLSGLVAVVIAIHLLIIYLGLNLYKQRALAAFILVFVSYWLAGGAYILYTFSIIAIELISKKHACSKSLLQTIYVLIAYVIEGVLVPFLFYQFVLVENLFDSYISRAFYQIRLIVPWPLFFLLASVPALIAIAGILFRANRNGAKNYITIVLSFVLAIVFVLGAVLFPNFSEEKEMHYDNLVVQKKWNEIIALAENDKPKGQQGKIALSLALAQTGQMSTRLFEFNPSFNDFFIPFNRRGMAPLIANEPYFYLGLNNFSKMLCTESIESTPDEKIPVRAAKRLIENYIIDGQYRVAERYLWYLQQTLFYRKWAKNAKTYLYNDKKVELHPLWGKLRSQKTHDDFYFQFERNDVALITLLRSNQQNKWAYEYLMCWYLLQKDFDEFLKYLPLEETMGYNELPLVFQEALVYVKTLFDEVPENLKQYRISAGVQQMLNNYAQAFQQGGSQKPAEMKKQFGNTYWYYVHFIETKDE